MNLQPPLTKEFVVIFKTKRQLPMPKEYNDLSAKLVEIVSSLPGFLKIETVADQNGNGVSVSYWRSLEAIQAWKANSTHLHAQAMGKSTWYQDYTVEICEVVKRYGKS